MALRIAAQFKSVSVNLKPKLPDRFKGTIVEKWADYWRNLCIDYTQAIKDLRSDIQENPMKALQYTGGMISAYFLYQNNPTELDFNDDLRKITNEIILVGEDCRNTESIEHIRKIQDLYSEDVLKYQSFGLFSILYRTEYSNKCDLYKAKCEYLTPSYFSMPQYVMDVGIMGRWWNLYIKTSDYDINC